jgi:high-affinity nickel-transport protein
MSLVDSLDSILMLYSYAGWSGRTWTLLGKDESNDMDFVPSPEDVALVETAGAADDDPDKPTFSPPKSETQAYMESKEERANRKTRLKRYTMSNLSIVLTIMSIAVAYRCGNF